MTRAAARRCAELAYAPPWDGAALLGFLGKRAVSGINRLQGTHWMQSVRIGRCTGWLRLDCALAPARIGLEVSASLLAAMPAIVQQVRRALDLDTDAAAIHAALSSDPLLAPSLARCPGLRVPGSIDGFEMALRAVLGQQVSVAAATTLFGRLVDTFGEDLPAPSEPICRLVPAPEMLAAANLDVLAAIGIPRARARTLQAVAAAVAAGTLDLQGPGGAARAAFAALPGIGPWTLEYVAMRALRDPDAFPAGDVGVRRALPGLSAREILARAERWRPWRAYAAMHLWGLLTPPAR